MKNIFDNPYTNIVLLSLLVTLNIFIIPILWSKIKFKSDNSNLTKQRNDNTINSRHSNELNDSKSTDPKYTESKVDKSIKKAHKKMEKEKNARIEDINTKGDNNFVGGAGNHVNSNSGDVNTNTGTNYGNIGGSNNTVNNGIKQRYLTDEEKSYIEGCKIEKDIDIDIFFPDNNEESKIFAKEIYDFFIQKGYYRVRGLPGIPFGVPSTLHVNLNNGRCTIFVPVASNIKQ